MNTKAKIKAKTNTEAIIDAPKLRIVRNDYERAKNFTGDNYPAKIGELIEDLKNGTIKWQLPTTATQNGNGAAGSSTEVFHGVVVNNKKTADYKGWLELKSINLNSSVSLLTLFNKVPSYVVENGQFVKKRGLARKIWERFAYECEDSFIEDGRKKKKLQQTVRLNEVTRPSLPSAADGKHHEITMAYRNKFLVLSFDGKEEVAWPESDFKGIAKLKYMVVWELEQTGTQTVKVKGKNRQFPVFTAKNATIFWEPRNLKALTETATLSLDLRMSQHNEAKKYHLPRDRGWAWRLREASALYKNRLELIRNGELLV